MDRINFLAGEDFPVSTNTFDRLQQAANMAACLALLGGSNYILSGCVADGDDVTPGVIVIAGEIMPFLGGAKMDKVTIQETKTTLEAFDVEYPEAYINRVAMFAVDGQYNWVDFKQVLTNKQLEDRIAAIRSESPGFVKMWSGEINRLDESKYLLCDGRIVNTATYPDLAYFYGKENEVSFQLPDLRRRFITGYDNSGTDYNQIGKFGGEEKHALTADENGEHQHIVPWGENLSTAWQPDWSYPNERFNNSRGYNADTDNDNTWPYVSPSGKSVPHENRPPFYVLAFVVRVNY
jgi:microcystin-dependent protein